MIREGSIWTMKTMTTEIITREGRTSNKWSWPKKCRSHVSPWGHIMRHGNTASRTKCLSRVPTRIQRTSTFRNIRSSIRKVGCASRISPWRLNISTCIHAKDRWRRSLHGSLRFWFGLVICTRKGRRAWSVTICMNWNRRWNRHHGWINMRNYRLIIGYRKRDGKGWYTILVALGYISMVTWLPMPVWKISVS